MNAGNHQAPIEGLRRPDFGRYSSIQAVHFWRDAKEISICPPLAKLSARELIQWDRPQQENRTWRLYFYAGCWLFTLLRDWESTKSSIDRASKHKELRRLVLSLCDFFNQNSSCDLERYNALEDHSVAWRVSILSYFSLRQDIVYESERKEKLLACIMRSVEILKGFLSSERWSGSNHTIFHAEAVFDATLAFPEERAFADARSIAEDALRKLYKQLFDGVEGATTEQAAYYHSFNMSLLQQHGIYLKGIGEYELLGDLDYKSIFRFFETLVGQAEFLPPIGDTSIRSPSKMKELRERFSPEAAIGGELPVGVFMYPRTGYHVFRSNDQEVGVTSVIYLTKDKRIHHGHFDGGSYLIERNGKWVVTDSGGPYAYGNKLRFDHFMSPSAHNCLLLDDQKECGLSVPVKSSREGSWICSASPGISRARQLRWLHLTVRGVVIVVDRVLQVAEAHPVILVHSDIDAKLLRIGETCCSIILDRETLYCGFGSTEKGKLTVFNPADDDPRARATRQHESIEPGGLLEYRLARQAVYAWHVFSPFGSPAVNFEVSGAELKLDIQDGAGQIEVSIDAATCAMSVRTIT